MEFLLLLLLLHFLFYYMVCDLGHTSRTCLFAHSAVFIYILYHLLYDSRWRAHWLILQVWYKNDSNFNSNLYLVIVIKCKQKKNRIFQTIPISHFLVPVLYFSYLRHKQNLSTHILFLPLIRYGPLSSFRSGLSLRASIFSSNNCCIVCQGRPVWSTEGWSGSRSLFLYTN